MGAVMPFDVADRTYVPRHLAPEPVPAIAQRIPVPASRPVGEVTVKIPTPVPCPVGETTVAYRAKSLADDTAKTKVILTGLRSWARAAWGAL